MTKRGKTYRDIKKEEQNKLETEMPDSRKSGKYAKIASDLNSYLRGNTISLNNATKSTVQNYLNNPDSNASSLGDYIYSLYRTNGTVGRIIDYYSSLPTYYHNIYPLFDAKDSFNIEGVSITDYLTVADQLDKYQIGLYAPYFIKQALIYGVAFFYEVANNSGVVYIEFPMSLCKISMIEDGVYRWMIDMSKVRDNMLDVLPSELQTAYETFTTSGAPTDNAKWNGNYYLVGNKGFAITGDMSALRNGGVAISPLASLILDTLNVNKAKENVDIKDDIDTVKIIHGKIPTDSKTGDILMPPEEASLWQQVLGHGLPTGVAPVVTPFTLENISLVGSGNHGAYETVNDAQKQVYKSVGVPASMFGDTTTSSNIVKLSILKDSAWIYTTYLPVITSYYNSVLAKVKTDGSAKWRIKFFEQNAFTKEDTTKIYKDAVTLGGSRTDYLASTGMNPLEIYSKLVMEQKVLNIDELMTPKPSSYTMSGTNNPNSGEVGRPQASNPTDDTDRINDSQ